MRSRLIAVAMVLLVAAGIFGWFSWMEKKSVALPFTSPQLQDDPHLLARRVLGKAGHVVFSLRTPGLALDAARPGDLLLLPRRLGPLESGERQRLLDWVEEGGTLVTTLRRERADREWLEDSLLAGVAEASEEEYDETSDEDAPDSLEADTGRIGQETVDSLPLANLFSLGKRADGDSTWICLPTLDYPLQVHDDAFPRLAVDEDVATPEWIDSASRLVVLEHGTGRIVVAGGYDWMTNSTLGQRDHAQLLVELCRWGGRDHRVLLVDSIDVPPWYRWLWNHAWSLVIGTCLLLVLWLWHAMVRREPTLPSPDARQRSLREHVEASGQWWWACEDGPETLLRRVREEAMERLLLRHPSLTLLAPNARIGELARLLGTDPERVRLALNEPVGREPAAFTRTLRLLQELEERR